MSNKNPRFSTVFLDADGTLFDFDKAQQSALKRVLNQYNYPWNQKINQMFAEENEKLWHLYEQNLITKDELCKQRFQRFFKHIGIRDVNNTEEINETYIAYMAQRGELIEGAYTLCQILCKFVDVYITTNGMNNAKEGMLQKSGLGPFIKEMFVSDVVGYQKPAVQYFDYIFKKQGITDKSKVIILGDSLTADMQGGRNAGISTCLFDPENQMQFPQPLCDYKITTLSQFLKVVL